MQPCLQPQPTWSLRGLELWNRWWFLKGLRWEITRLDVPCWQEVHNGQHQLWNQTLTNQQLMKAGWGESMTAVSVITCWKTHLLEQVHPKLKDTGTSFASRSERNSPGKSLCVWIYAQTCNHFFLNKGGKQPKITLMNSTITTLSFVILSK